MYTTEEMETDASLSSDNKWKPKNQAISDLNLRLVSEISIL